MHTALLGTDYRQGSLSQLEKIVFDEAKIKRFTNSLPQNSPIEEMVILSTCNRMEIYHTCKDPDYSKTWLSEHIASFFKLDTSQIGQLFYHSHCRDTVAHLFNVASGTQSMVFGENEILSQVKHAYTLASSLKSTGPYLNKLFQSAIAVGKKVREKTRINEGSYSISSIAIDALRQHFGQQFHEQHILVIGAGIMAQRALKKLTALEHSKITVSNRTVKTAIELSEEFNTGIMPLTEVKRHLSHFDAIYIATSSSDYILQLSDKDLFQKPTVIVDVSVPRNVDPGLASHPMLHLISIDKLEGIANDTLKERRKEASKITKMIQEEAADFTRWYLFKKEGRQAELLKSNAA